MSQRRAVWHRLATDMKPRHLAEMTRTIGFDDLPAAFDAFVKGQVRGRTVVKIT
jgi:alcohol dehydrogenase